MVYVQDLIKENRALKSGSVVLRTLTHCPAQEKILAIFTQQSQ